jgi:hypothetical protein
MMLMIFAILFNMSFAQTSEMVSFEGQVLERGTRKPMPDVNIFALPLKIKVTTDKQGRFQFPALPKGEVEFVINVADYNKFSQKVALSESQSGTKFFVEKNKYQYFETTVTDLRNKKDDSQKRLRQEEFLQMPGSGGDPVKAVQNLPGVNRTSGGDARVVIQGSEPEDTKYNIDGHQVPLVFHFGGLSSVVTPEAVGSVDYFSAGYGPEFGRALGRPRGPERAQTKNRPHPRHGFHGHFQYGRFGRRAAVRRLFLSDQRTIFLSGPGDQSGG